MSFSKATWTLLLIKYHYVSRFYLDLILNNNIRINFSVLIFSEISDIFLNIVLPVFLISRYRPLRPLQIQLKEVATISSLMTFCCVTCPFFSLKQKRSSTENNFLYLLLSMLFSATLENLTPNNLWFAMVSLLWNIFFPQRPYQISYSSIGQLIILLWNKIIFM